RADVLDDDDRRGVVCRQPGQDRLQRLRAARRSADSDDPGGRGRGPRGWERVQDSAAGRRGKTKTPATTLILLTSCSANGPLLINPPRGFGKTSIAPACRSSKMRSLS